MKPTLKLCAAALIILINLTASAAVHYVSQTSPAPTPPYVTWDTAAINIQDAIDAAIVGDEILVTNGVYASGGRAVYGTMTNRVVIDKAVTVRSVNGPELTFIVGQGVGGASNTNGDGAIRCAYVGTDAVLSGFTLTNGHTLITGDVKKEQRGGGAWCEQRGMLTNCILIGNSAGFGGGGAIYGILNNCTLTGNSAQFGGGAFSNTVNNCTLVANTAQYEGGGAFHATLNNCVIKSNSANAFGGGASSSRLLNCDLLGNRANDSGGGASFAMLTNCNFVGNTAAINGGGGGHRSTLNNCILTENSAKYGGGVSYSTLNNCTLTANSGEYGGGSYHGFLNNCIIYYNTARNSANCYDSTNTYCCTTPLSAGAGNIDAEPLMASTTHLSAQSPCIGRGSPDYAGGVDIDGEAWLNPPCIGADQFVSGTANGPLTVSIPANYTNVAVGTPVSFVAENSGSITAAAWDFGDGVVVSNVAFVHHAWSTPGLFEVRLTGYNDSYPNGVSDVVLVRVAAQEVYYVNASNTSPSYPFTTWAGAATTIQEAIDAGTQLGRLVRVTNGFYAAGGRAMYGELTNRVVVPEGVEVRSENGPAETIIAGQAAPVTTNGNGAIRCAYLGYNAVLSGFTLTNGHTLTNGDLYKGRSGGGAWSEDGGVLTNCILSGNTAYVSGGGALYGTLKCCVLIGNAATNGGGAYSSTLTECTLTGNSANSGGGGNVSTMINCVLSGNSAYNGGGVSSGTLINCVLTGNSAIEGGGANSGDLFNCTVVGNSASTGGGTSRGTLNNCIIYYNTASSNPNFYYGLFTNSCTTPMPSGTGNIISAPIFINTNGWANLRLQSTSPCIDAGKNASVTCSADLDGNPRIFGDAVDMGAYEFQGFTHYVNANNANPKPPYSTWNTAATNIQDAIDAAIVGDEILVTNGVYASGGRAVYGTMTNRVVIDKAVTVRSVNGPELTFIVGQGVGGASNTNGDGAIRCAYVGTDAVLSGFTLTNGHTRTSGDIYQEGSGGGVLCDKTGCLTNCILIGNSAGAYGGGVYCIKFMQNDIYSNTLNNCIFINNSAGAVGGGAAGGILNRCSLSSNSVTGFGGGASRGILNNCTLTANSASRGGGMFMGILNNCTLAGNLAGIGGGAYSGEISNSIVFCNSATNDGPNYYGSMFSCSCTTPLPSSGSDNITNAPLFMDTNEWANLRLQPNSPCINAGNNTSALSPIDLDSNPRIAGGRVDMGAYEFQGVGLAGLPGWLWQYGLPTDGSADSIDSDADGLNNYQEWRAGTDPTSPSSVLRLNAQPSASTVQLQWQGVSGINYYLQRSTNLSATPPFQPLATNISGTAGPMTYTDDNPPAQVPLFYRLGVSE